MSSLIATDFNSRPFATATDIRSEFDKRHQELHRLAFFITADQSIAAECLADACTLTQNRTSVFEPWLATWARYATVRAALNHQRNRIKECSASYRQNACVHGGHPRLSPEVVNRVLEQSDALIASMDVLARVALIVCGVEGHSLSEAALLVGQNKSTVLAAYCAALSAAFDAGFALDYGYPNHH